MRLKTLKPLPDCYVGDLKYQAWLGDCIVMLLSRIDRLERKIKKMKRRQSKMRRGFR